MRGFCLQLSLQLNSISLQLVYNYMTQSKATIESQIISYIKKNGPVATSDLVESIGFSRQYIQRIVSGLVKEKKIFKQGSTRNALYVSEEKIGALSYTYSKDLDNTGLEEHVIFEGIERNFSPYQKLSDHVKSILFFAFSEMLNNAIDHSRSKKINITITTSDQSIIFFIRDNGIGVFRNVMKNKKLEDERSAVQDILKGKTTTMPQLHSGEGIFFTSKIADYFALDSYGYQLIIDNEKDDIFLNTEIPQLKGTKVTFSIDMKTPKHLNDIFKTYTNQSEESDYGFDKTEIRVQLYAQGGIYISRSQARRIVSGLEKFSIIVMDYKDVPTVGQAFADEVYRVFQNRHPDIVLVDENMNEGVNFMVERARNESKKS